MIKKIHNYYLKIALVKKLLIPPAIGTFLSLFLVVAIIKQVQMIEENIEHLQNELIPSLEKSTNNIDRLKKISDNFTFAVLTSELDMISKNEDYNVIGNNLNEMLTNKNLNTHDSFSKKRITTYLNTFESYFQIAQLESLKIINNNSIDNNENKLNELLKLNKKTKKYFLLLNMDIKKQIHLKTNLIKKMSKEIIYFILIYLLFASIILFSVSFLIYNSFNKRFQRLSKTLDKLAIQKSLKDSTYDELYVLSANVNIAIQEFNDLEKKVQLDKLTNLYNRHYLDDFFSELEKKKLSYGIILLDIDHFKKVNDTYGHLIGDDVLIRFSEILKSETRNQDIVGRWGGEEFLIITLNITSQALFAIAQKIRKRIEDEVFPEVGKITASFGSSLYKNGLSSSDIIKFADDGLYRAKNEGRNRVVMN